MTIHQHEIDAQVETAIQTKLRHNYDMACVVCKKWLSGSNKVWLGFHFESGLNVGDVGQHCAGSFFEVLEVIH